MSSIKAQLAAEARSRRLQATSREFDIKRETCRKIIYGAAFLNLLDQLPPGTCTELLARVHRHVVRDADRASLDLPPLPAPKGQARNLDQAPAQAAALPRKAPLTPPASQTRQTPDSGDGVQGRLAL